MAFIQGEIYNVRSQILSSTYGGISTDKYGNVSGGYGTSHQYYTEFFIDNMKFRCDGDLTFAEGDIVAVYYTQSNKGYMDAHGCKNFTRNFIKYINEIPYRDYFWSLISSIGFFCFGFYWLIEFGMGAMELSSISFIIGIACYFIGCKPVRKENKERKAANLVIKDLNQDLATMQENDF